MKITILSLFFLTLITSCSSNQPDNSEFDKLIAEATKYTDFEPGFTQIEIPNEGSREILNANAESNSSFPTVGINTDDNTRDFSQATLNAISEIADVEYDRYQKPYFFYKEEYKKRIFTKTEEGMFGKTKKTLFNSCTYKYLNSTEFVQDPQYKETKYLLSKFLIVPPFKKIPSDTIQIKIFVEKRDGKWMGFFRGIESSDRTRLNEKIKTDIETYYN
jgi:hypothetical protein